ncbi:sensor histidine kinase [Micromonospora craterilacus]|uniref:sensor histidine kinase n=1 Tax=Micromonospora craterilacus TaxID=1655439 RepID=UPI001F2A9049|nr:sensor histidine kinase [Micromonospora craterilacus]
MVRLRGPLFDLGLALLIGLFGLFGTAPAGADQPGVVPPDGRAYTLVVVAALALAGRRRWPLATLAVSAGATSAFLVLGHAYGPILFSLFISVYTVAAYRPVRSAAIAAGAALVAVLVHDFVSAGTTPGLAGVVPGAAWVVVPFAVGVTVRVNREATARNRAEQSRKLADEERLRIAQEVHDVVGHGLAAIYMQAEIALHLLPKRPEQAETALTAISRTSREALDELRVTLAVVRRGDDRAPTPGLGQLDQLRDRLAGAGLPVTVEVTGEPRDLPTAVDLAGYRVAQESLTNVLRHAGSATATVRIGYTPTEVTVEVTDTGPRPGAAGARPGPVSRPGGAPATDGHGLAGMRERVAALGGEFAAGPRPEGGFRVYARLPVEPLS